jgi:tRNA threonylcarbamoyladenosine biosynthesis protein TsaE
MSTAESPSAFVEVVTRSVAETEELAARFASRLRPGDRVLLSGGLGAGKTAFVRGLVRGLGSPHVREVASPTFAIHHRYPDGRLAVDHLDLYRLRAPADLAAEGLEDVITDRSSVLCCEWPERMAAPPLGRTTTVRFAFRGEDVRALRFEATTPDAIALLPESAA